MARALCIGESPTLLRLVHSDASFASDALVAYEEAAVLACQRFVVAARR